MRRKLTVRKLGDVRGDRTDWERVDAMTGEELERNIAADPDADIAAPDWTRARLVIPQRKISVHLASILKFWSGSGSKGKAI